MCSNQSCGKFGNSVSKQHPCFNFELTRINCLKRVATLTQTKKNTHFNVRFCGFKVNVFPKPAEWVENTTTQRNTTILSKTLPRLRYQLSPICSRPQSMTMIMVRLGSMPCRILNLNRDLGSTFSNNSNNINTTTIINNN